jgi:hypothetical protein
MVTNVCAPKKTTRPMMRIKTPMDLISPHGEEAHKRRVELEAI